MLAIVILIPLGLGVAWGLHMAYSKFVDWSTGCAILLALTFTTCSIIGFATWYSHNWALDMPARVLFYIAGASCAVFAILLTVVPKNYTFSGTTAIFLCLNFAPAAYLIYLKARWDDVDLKLLYTEISKQIMEGKFSIAVIDENDDTSQSHEDKILMNINSVVKSKYKTSQTCKSCAAIAAYFLTLISYAVVIGFEESNGAKATGAVICLWIMASDFIILSLNSYWAEISSTKRKGIAIIYEPQFQASYLLVCRIIVSYSVDDWLFMQGLILIGTSVIAALNLSQVIARKWGLNRSALADMQKIYTKSPMLQTMVQSKIPDLKCNIEQAAQNIFLRFTDTCAKSRTEVLMVFYFIFYGCNIFLPYQFENWLSTNESTAVPDKNKDATGQTSLELPGSPQKVKMVQIPVYRTPSILDHLVQRKMSISRESQIEDGIFNQGVVMLFLALIISGFVLWFNVYKSNNFKFTKGMVISAVALLVLAAVFSALLAITSQSYFALSTILLLPCTALSFAIFYGLWSTNDYQLFEPSKVKKVSETVKERTEGKSAVVACNTPKTQRDWLSIGMLISNFILLIIYLIVAQIVQGVYGATLVLFIILVELTFLLFVMYNQTNFRFTASVSVLLVTTILVYVLMVVNFKYRAIEGEYSDETTKRFFSKLLGEFLVFGAFLYLVILTSGLILIEYTSSTTDSRKEKKTYSVQFYILAGLSLLMCLLYGLWVMYQQKKFILGGMIILLTTYPPIAFLVNDRILIWIKRIYAAVLVCFGLAIFYFKISSPTIISDLSVAFFGLYVLCIGAYIRANIQNSQKRDLKMCKFTQEVLPMLEYDVKDNKMKSESSEPVFFFLTMFCVIVWSLITCILSRTQTRWMPLVVLSVALARTILYAIDKSYQASTVDGRTFLQATLQFYVSALHTSTNNKLEWRSHDGRDVSINAPDDGQAEWGRGVQEAANSQIMPKFDPASIKGDSQYYKEMVAVQNWYQASSKVKKNLGLFSNFFDPQKPDSEKDRSECNAHFAQQDYKLNSYSGYFSNLQDIKQEKDESKKNEAVDEFLKFVDDSRREVYLDQQFWAFMNGYLHQRMHQLQSNQTAILDNIIAAYNVHLDKRPLTSVPILKINQVIATPDQLLDEEQKSSQQVQVKVKEKIQLTLSSLCPYLEKDVKNLQSFNDFVKTQLMIGAGGELVVVEVSPEDKAKNDAEVVQLGDIFKQINELQAQKDLTEKEQAIKAKLLLDAVKVKTRLSMREQKQKRLEFKAISEQRIAWEAEQAEIKKKQEENLAQREVDAGMVANRDLQESGGDASYLKLQGDKILNRIKEQVNGGSYQDSDFSYEKALGPEFKSKYGWSRADQMRYMNNKEDASEKVFDQSKLTVFANKIEANNIKQGGIGDCYLISALSVMAHCQPQLLRKIFHPQCRVKNQDGAYVIMLYSGGRPVLITVDDYFASSSDKTHPFVEVISDRNNTKSIWPMLLEKAYAKMFGGYPAIVGGHVHQALADLTNGIPEYIDLHDPSTKEELTTGQFWQKLKFWTDHNYLMGAASPHGKDTDTSSLGIVQGHAYSVLDIAEIDGVKLIQLRNPWGNATEWKGAWGDDSSQWTQKRKNMIYQHMKTKKLEQSSIGLEDGIFWMSLTDFFLNFECLNLCRYQDETWQELSFEESWSKTRGNAGGCKNHTSFKNNPMARLTVQCDKQIEVFMNLKIRTKPGQERGNHSIGFNLLELDEKESVSNLSTRVFVNDGGYSHGDSVSWDGKLKPPTRGKKYMIVPTTFTQGQEADFKFTLWYKKDQGKVTMQKTTTTV